MREGKFILLFVILTIALPAWLNAQTNLAEHGDFLLKKKADYSSVLDSLGLSGIFKVDSFQIEDNSLKANIFCNSKRQWNMLAKDWRSSESGLPISQTLMQKLSFVTNVETKQLRIEIDCSDAEVLIAYRGNVTTTKVIDKMGGVTSEPVLAMPQAPSPVSGTLIFTCKSKEKDAAYKYLYNNLKKYFSGYAVKFAPYNCEEFPTDELLRIDVSNVTKVVIDKGYFERLTVLISIDNTGPNCVLHYAVWGKYASGIIWSPVDDRYSNMSPAYTDQLVSFNDKFKSKLYQILKKI